MSVEWGKSIQKNIINTDKSLKRIVILFQIYLYDSILFIILVQWSFSAYISEFVKTYSCIKLLGNYTAAILTLEQNHPERMSSMYKKILSGAILLKSQICDCVIFCYTALFWLATRILPAFFNFGQAKHGQNGHAATFCQKGICCPVRKHHFTSWTHPDISLPFRAGGQRVKEFRF